MCVITKISTRTYWSEYDVIVVVDEPFRATHFHSPGWNEGKARYETLGKHRQKRIELRRSGTYPRKQMPQRINTLRRKKPRTATTQTKCALLVPPLWGSINVSQWLTQGLRPGLCRSIALAGLIYVFPINILYCFDAVALTKRLLQGSMDSSFVSL